MTVQQQLLARARNGSENVSRRERDQGSRASTLRVGDWVEVRSKEEILRTLDSNGELENMPFMPEMLQYCGQRFRVHKRAHKSCDTISGATQNLRVKDAIHLNLRCNGSAHGGCQADCLLYWKDAWLKPLDSETSTTSTPSEAHGPGCTEQQLLQAARGSEPETADRYSCQTTRMLSFSEPLAWWSLGQYREDYVSGNASLKNIWHALAYATYVKVTLANRRTLGIPSRWLYDQFQRLRGGLPYPARKGKLGEALAFDELNLQPGELVRVKSYDVILRTLDTSGRNRNLSFDQEMVPYCGRAYRVRSRVERFLDERSGRMQRLKTPAVILEEVVCQACFSSKRLLCPRSIYPWWREIWLERVSDEPAAKS